MINLYKWLILLLVPVMLIGCISDKSTAKPDTGQQQAWGDYASLTDIVQGIAWRVVLLSAILIALTWALTKYITVLEFIPKMWLSIVSAVIIFGVRMVLGWLIPFHYAGALIDSALSVFVANWIYKAIFKKALFVRD